jgi:quercetin dioxygenase-like cupin family protein
MQSHPIAGTNQELREYLITYPAGVAAPVHHHPVVGLGFIVEGTAESQFDGEDLRVYHAGDSFQDRAITKHVVFRNPDRTKPLRFVIFYRIEKGKSVVETDAP